MSVSFFAAMAAIWRARFLVCFFIAPSLFAGCGPSRNQPNHFFTLIGKPCVDYKENRTWANLAQCDVAIFFALMGYVPNGDGIGILEHKLSRLEIDAMLGEILPPLALIALETHRAATLEDNHCTYSCQY
jgi:hypothetical protein